MTAFEEYCEIIERMNLGNAKSERIDLTPKTASTKIMTRLRHRRFKDINDSSCENPIDVLYVSFSSLTRSWIKTGYLFSETYAIVYGLTPDLVLQLEIEQGIDEKNEMNFSEFKRSHLTEWYSINQKRMKKDIQLQDGKKLHLWSVPYILNAVTDYDKNFGQIWNGGDLVYKGNEYGDTSRFFIIGTIN